MQLTKQRPHQRSTQHTFSMAVEAKVGVHPHLEGDSQRTAPSAAVVGGLGAVLTVFRFVIQIVWSPVFGCVEKTPRTTAHSLPSHTHRSTSAARHPYVADHRVIAAADHMQAPPAVVRCGGAGRPHALAVSPPFRWVVGAPRALPPLGPLRAPIGAAPKAWGRRQARPTHAWTARSPTLWFCPPAVPRSSMTI